MNWLIGTSLIYYYMILSLFHIVQSLVLWLIVQLFDRILGTEVYDLETRPYMHRMHLAIWKKLLEVHKKYFPEDVKEISRFEQEIREIRKEM